MAWHLYEDPVIPESAKEASSSLQLRLGPHAEDLDKLHDFAWNKCGKLMRSITSLTEQYWGHRNVIKYGAPKLKAVNARSTNQPVGYEWNVINGVEDNDK
jgi:hypothetical protein